MDGIVHFLTFSGCDLNRVEDKTASQCSRFSKGTPSDSSVYFIDQGCSPLDREIQTLVLGPFNAIVGGANRHTLGALERRASLDSLAALTILLRLRHEENEPECVWLYALSIFRVLLIIGPQLDDYGVAERLFQLYVERVFSLAVWKQQRMDLANYQYVKFAHLLAELADLVRSKDPSLSGNRKMPTFYAIQILDGRYQQAFKEFFQIPVVITE